jgi:peptidoglycan/xylan/chitin deacetylase (PgdA/CDA1 family)
MKKLLKSKLSKLKFQLGFSPKIENTGHKDQFIPKDKKTVILISADLELAWAPRYDSSIKDPLRFAEEKARTERKNIPLIISLCEKYDIPITWATVGHLFLESCERKNGVAHPEIPKVNSYSNKYWKFNSKDWFEYDPCSDYLKDPLWYGPDIIRAIQESRVKHEIGNHTFSHIDCRDEICEPELLRAELKASKLAAEKFGIDLKSFVHPGHTIGNLDVLAEEKFTNFRTDYDNILGYPKKHENGLWELLQTAEFNLRKEWSINYHIYRHKKIIERAIGSNKVCVFWFHPSFDTKVVEHIWPEVFNYISENRKDIWITTHSEYVNWLESKNP